MNASSTDLLSAAYIQATAAGSPLWLGGYRDATSPPFREWRWADGTNATNLNCGIAGCGPFAAGEPK